MEQKRLEARRKRYQDLLQKVSTEETPAGPLQWSTEGFGREAAIDVLILDAHL